MNEADFRATPALKGIRFLGFKIVKSFFLEFHDRKVIVDVQCMEYIEEHFRRRKNTDYIFKN